MADPQVTIVVVSRERFSFAGTSLESIYTNTEFPFDLIYVDSGSPRKIKLYIENMRNKMNFRILRENRYLSPNQARNLALPHVKSRYVVFMDNDVLVSQGWLAPLVECAEGTGTSLVGPLYLMGKPEDEIIHMAGGDASIGDENGRRVYHEEDRFSGMSVRNVRPDLTRERCDLVEFHCMLARMSVIKSIGYLDEKLLGIRDHEDLCLTVSESNGTIYIEPKSVVTYVPPPPITLSDFSYYMFRWNEVKMKSSLRHFHKKWNLDMDESEPDYNWLWKRRHIFLWQYTKPFRPIKKFVRKLF